MIATLQLSTLVLPLLLGGAPTALAANHQDFDKENKRFIPGRAAHSRHYQVSPRYLIMPDTAFHEVEEVIHCFQ